MPRDPLEAVYRLIGLFRYQEAIHLLNKILKKQPKFLVAKVWKCEALYGMGNIAECEELMSEILDQAYSDKPAIDCIAEFYRARGNYTKLVEVYENALKQDPNDEKWRKALFECCGLAGDYKKQQQQAFVLYKQTPRMLFYCMAVVCLMQQAKESPVSLEVAERMMIKKCDDGKVKSKHELILLITVLEKRGKFQEALDLLESVKTDLESIISTEEKKMELLIKLQKWENVVIQAKQALLTKPDNWLYWKQYLMGVVELELAQNENDVDNTQTKALIFLDNVQKMNPKLRGPHLAGIELCKLTSQKDNILIDRFVQFIDLFGDKPICLFDLSTYVNLIPEKMKTQLLERISCINYNEMDAIELQNIMTPAKHVSFLQLSKLLGLQLNQTIQQREKYCLDLLKCYKAVEMNQKREQYLLLMTYERIELFKQTSNALHLIEAICAIENGLESSPAFALQVLQLQLYFALGASKAARVIYEKLRIQSVQVDTLVHIFLANLSSTGHFTLAADMWENALKILQQCTVESLEALVWSYRVGLFHRVEEFTTCARRFQRTITVPLLKTEKIILDLITSEPSRAEQLLSRIRGKIDWENCVDNRDMKAVPTWEPPSSDNNRMQSYNELLIFCKIREAILFSLITGIAYIKDRQESNQKLFHNAIDVLQNLYTQALSMKIDLPNTRLQHVIKTPLNSIFEKFFEFDLNESEKISAMLKQSTDDAIEIIKENHVKNPRLGFEIITTQMELLTFSTICCGILKLNLPPVPRRRCEIILRTLISSWTSLDANLIINYETTPSGNSPTRQMVHSKLQENYKAANDEIRKVIRKKLSYLQKLNHT